MPLSTAKRESLIPRLHLLSIALLLIVAFIVLMPSRDTFTFSAAATKDANDIKDLDIAYLKARDARGDLSDDELRNIIRTMIRGKKWQHARDLLATRPNIELDPRDEFLLDLDTATAGFYGADNEAQSASYKANLVGLMRDLFDTPVLHDEVTLTTAAEFTSDLDQPILASRYYQLLASNYPRKQSEHFYSCAKLLDRHHFYGETVECYQSAVATAPNAVAKTHMQIRLGKLHARHGHRDAVQQSIETLVAQAPNDRDALDSVATFALENERPDVAYPLYARIAEVEPDKRIYWLEKAVTWAEASNQPGIAAEYVLTIREQSDKQYFSELSRRRQALLVAAGRNDEALATLHERIAAKPNDHGLLLEGIQLASGMGLTAQAQEWNETILETDTTNLDAMSRQVDYALSNKRINEALVWSKKILDADPYSYNARLRVAQLEEWTGNVDNAMRQRVKLAQDHPSLDTERELVRLAELNWDSLTAAKALQRISKRKTLSTEEIQKLVALYEADGQPKLAIAALRDMMGGTEDAMILRELAVLQTRHIMYEPALATWEEFADRFGRSAEESLSRMELLWRLRRPEEAVAVTEQIDQFNTGSASQYQLSLLTELGWRYKKPELVYASAPYMDKLDSELFGLTNARRIVQSLIDDGNYTQAITTAENRWRETDDITFLMYAINLALREEIYPHYERYLDANGDLLKLREVPEYWVTVADYYNKKSDVEGAIETYKSALEIDPKSTLAMTGLAWSMLGNDTDDETMLSTLSDIEQHATDQPELWSPLAVGYLAVNQPETSLRWFSKLMMNETNDYNILLSFADALEQTGNAPHAYKVRLHAMQQLLPVAMASAGDSIDQMSRTYISMLQSYGSTAENEAWTERLLDGVDKASPKEAAWRRELAASWYLSTQRHEYARVVMTKMHERRLESPVWQQLSLALAEDNLPEIKEILASSREKLSSGDQILALRKLGYETEAFALAKKTVNEKANATERAVAMEHMISLRNSRPAYTTGILKQREMGNLDITESGLSLRHTLSAADLGFAVDYKRNKLTSPTLPAVSNEDDIALSAHFGNSLRGGKLTAGVNANSASDLSYTAGEYYIRDQRGKSELTTAVSYNKVAENGEVFRTDARQDIKEVAYRHTLGKRDFIRISGNINELATRDTDVKIARGYSAAVELGTTGSFGSNNWTMGLSATGVKNDRNMSQPLATSLNDQSQQLAVSASMFRGGIGSEYPQAASPRYHFSARFGVNWAEDNVFNVNSTNSALNLQAGAGFRILGNDELSFTLEHDHQNEELNNGDSNSAIGVQYTNHFK